MGGSGLHGYQREVEEEEVVEELEGLEEQKESLQDRLYQLEADHSETNTLLQTTHLQLVDTQQKLARSVPHARTRTCAQAHHRHTPDTHQ